MITLAISSLVKGVNINNEHVFILLNAEDIVLMSETEEELQELYSLV